MVSPRAGWRAPAQVGRVEVRDDANGASAVHGSTTPTETELFHMQHMQHNPGAKTRLLQGTQPPSLDQGSTIQMQSFGIRA
jgi:hypothetical protein